MATSYESSSSSTIVSPVSPAWPLASLDGNHAGNLRSMKDSTVTLGSIPMTSQLIEKGWSHSSNVYHVKGASVGEKILVVSDEKVVWIAFPGTHDYKDVVTDSKFGEVQITDRKLSEKTCKEYYGCGFDGLNDNHGNPVLVHKGFLQRFVEIMENKKLYNEVETARVEGKQVIFTGHSLGGAIAVLATLWLLNQQKSSESRKHGKPPCCLTFGAPLLGDAKMAEAVRREHWAEQLCHIVSRHDIVPRILLAPLDSLKKPLKALIPYWLTKMNAGESKDQPLEKQEVDNLLAVVKGGLSAVANSLLGATKNVFKNSPYRPFGTFIFCHKTGAASLDNPVMVLQMLWVTLQEHDSSPDTKRSSCIMEHVQYDKHVQEMGEVNAPGVWAGMAIPDAQTVPQMSVLKELQIIGAGVEALQRAPTTSQNFLSQQMVVVNQLVRDTEQRLAMNSAGRAAAFRKVQEAMVELEWYKHKCEEEGRHYYDACKERRDPEELQASKNRLQLANFWDETIELYNKNQLPDDFQVQNKWVNSGHAYRLLVEPLDIANYYRLGKHEDSGHYRHHGRPGRYRIVERWWHEKKRDHPRSKPGSLTRDSLLWAWLEEAREALDVLNHNAEHTSLEETTEAAEAIEETQLLTEAMDTLEKFEKHVGEEYDAHRIADDLFMKKCSWVAWWRDYQATKRCLKFPWDHAKQFHQRMERTWVNNDRASGSFQPHPSY